MTSISVDEWIGSFGVFLLLFAYTLNLIRVLSPGSRVYQGINAVGAAIACFASYRIGFFPFVILEGAWTLTSVVALIRRPAAQ